MAEQQPEQIILPERIVSLVDLSQVIRELEVLDESLRQSNLRQPGAPTQLARSGASLEELAKINNILLTDQLQREQLIELLRAFKKHAPLIHMSLATEPSAGFVRKILVWMRANLHPLVLLEIGLQPTMAAGCALRTNNKLFDMSLRHRFSENRHILLEKISEIGSLAEVAQAEQVATEAATPPAEVTA